MDIQMDSWSLGWYDEGFFSGEKLLPHKIETEGKCGTYWEVSMG